MLYGKTRAEGHSQTIKAIENDIDALRDDLKGLAKSLKSSSRDKYSDLRSWFTEATRDVKAGHRLGGAYDYLRLGGKGAAYKTMSRIEKRPLVSVLSAFAIGMAIAMLFRRSHTS